MPGGGDIGTAVIADRAQHSRHQFDERGLVCGGNPGCCNKTHTFLNPRLRWFDSGTGLSWNIRFLIDQGIPYDPADRSGGEAISTLPLGLVLPVAGRPKPCGRALAPRAVT